MNTSLRNIHTGTAHLVETIFGYDDDAYTYIGRLDLKALFVDFCSLHTNVAKHLTPEKGSFSHGMKVLATLLKRYGTA